MSVAPKALYSTAASYFHWMVAFPLVGCVGTVLKAQEAPKEEKGKWMWRHKSLGLLTGMIVAPRLAYRVFSSKSVGYSFLMILLDTYNTRIVTNNTFLTFYAFAPSTYSTTCRKCRGRRSNTAWQALLIMDCMLS